MRRALAWLKKGDTAAALRDVEQAIELDPKDPSNLMSRGAVMKALNRTNDAIVEYRKAIQLRPDPDRRKQAEQALLDLGVQP
jgi:Flp pilus assembly protein TadD